MKKKYLGLFSAYLLLIFNDHTLHANVDIYDPSASVYRFQKAMAKRGKAESQFKLGLMFETGTGVEQGLVNAILWYKKAADQNYKPAINRLIYLDIKESGFKDSQRKWLRNLKQDAQFNEGEALFLLGQMYAEGTGITKDHKQALVLLRKAARGDIPGSEAEIKRIEMELAKHKNKTAKSKIEAQRLNPAIHSSNPASAIAATPPLKTGLSPNKPFITVEQLRKQQARGKQIKLNKQRPVQIKRPQLTAQKAPLKTSNKTLYKPSISETATSEIPPQNAAALIDNEPHPMDIICTGRNMLHSGCR